jgi:hypothetical protein
MRRLLVLAVLFAGCGGGGGEEPNPQFRSLVNQAIAQQTEADWIAICIEMERSGFTAEDARYLLASEGQAISEADAEWALDRMREHC